MSRRFAWLLSLGVMAGLLAVAPAALAAGGNHTVTYTKHVHSTIVQNQKAPCTGDRVAITETVNGVQHITFFVNSDEVWATFTLTGSASFTDQGVDYTGHFTVWGNFNLNEQNQNSTFTFNITLTGSDGSRTSEIRRRYDAVAFNKLRLDGC